MEVVQEATLDSDGSFIGSNLAFAHEAMKELAFLLELGEGSKLVNSFGAISEEALLKCLIETIFINCLFDHDCFYYSVGDENKERHHDIAHDQDSSHCTVEALAIVITI